MRQNHTERALRHYVLDGFVTAHVALQQGMSRAYLYLSGFERDNKRKQAMCTRRSVLLSRFGLRLLPADLGFVFLLSTFGLPIRKY